MIWYVDTSAALKLVVEEPESPVLATELTRFARGRGERHLVASMLLFTELHCAAARRTTLPAAAINQVLDGLDLVDVERIDLERAATSDWGLRSADAIHLATALRLQADTVVTYDAELTAAAVRVGVPTRAPH
ncbi:MAG: type II toxin-antitoxin system VapC family toxin [Nocardioides sp.]